VRTIIWTTAVLLVVVLCSQAVTNYLVRTAAELSEQIVQVQALVLDSEWEMARAEFRRTDTRWSEVGEVWAAIIRHQEIDELEKSFARIQQFLASEERGLALAELEMAKLLLRHVPEKEKIRLHNIM